MASLPARFTITNPITAGLTAIERARGFLEAASLSDELAALEEKGLLRRQGDTTSLVYLPTGKM